MTLVLTNDDGIDAPGIAALRQALDQPCAIVAPNRPLSGCSHQLSRGSAIAIQPRTPQAYAIGGTPADCTRVAVSHLYPDTRWVLSGINAGGNMGADIYVSGTVAAVREAALLRIPGIALSQYIQGKQPINWEVSVRLAARVLVQLMAAPPPPGCFWNVNLPWVGEEDSEPELVECPCCTQPLPTEFAVKAGQFHYTGRYGERPRDPGSDVDVCFSGQISVSKICLW